MLVFTISLEIPTRALTANGYECDRMSHGISRWDASARCIWQNAPNKVHDNDFRSKLSKFGLFFVMGRRVRKLSLCRSWPRASEPICHHWGSVFIKSVAFRVQTAPFDKITTDFCRSRRRLHDSDFILTKNPNI